MAAAEYYTGAPMQAPTQAPTSTPYQQQTYYPPPPNNTSLTNHNNNNAPPYQTGGQDSKPAVHFAPAPRPPQHQHRPSFSSQAPIPIPQPQQQQHRPSFSNHHSSSQLTPQFHTSQPNSYHGTPPRATLQPPPPHHHFPSRPHLAGNPSHYSVNEGYASDPEPHRRRHRKHDHKDDREIKHSSKKDRSRSTDTDAFIGAAGGGLIGDLIFPGLGTVGGALAGWIGGKDYGKHRKNRKDRHEKEQAEWERKYRSRSNSDERRDGSRARRSYERHKHDY